MTKPVLPLDYACPREAEPRVCAFTLINRLAVPIIGCLAALSVFVIVTIFALLIYFLASRAIGH